MDRETFSEELTQGIESTWLLGYETISLYPKASKGSDLGP